MIRRLTSNSHVEIHFGTDVTKLSVSGVSVVLYSCLRRVSASESISVSDHGLQVEGLSQHRNLFRWCGQVVCVKGYRQRRNPKAVDSTKVGGKHENGDSRRSGPDK